MAEFVPVEDVAVFSVVQRIFNQNMVNNFHIKKEGGWDSASMANMANALISGYNDDMASNQGNNVQYVIVRCRDLSEENGAIAEVNFPPGSGGDAVFGSTIGNLAICVKHTTGRSGRSFRGRTYLGGIRSDALSNGFWLASVALAVENAFDALDAKITAAGGTWGVVSLYSGYTVDPVKVKKIPTPRAAGIFTDIINNSASNLVCTQNRRLIGHGD